LALVLSHQGKYEEAEEMHRQALRLRETVLGKEHPDTLTSMNNLASVLSNQGKYEQAEEMLRQALRLQEMVLGKEHPSTLVSKNNLAYNRKLQSQIQRETLGSDHPHAIASARMTPRAGHSTKKCDHCGAVKKQLKICSRCKTARYCGQGCQKAAWGKHKTSCGKK
jgi:tetratricopeptide (TPR) repeat protein